MGCFKFKLSKNYDNLSSIKKTSEILWKYNWKKWKKATIPYIIFKMMSVVAMRKTNVILCVCEKFIFNCIHTSTGIHSHSYCSHCVLTLLNIHFPM